MVEMAYLEFSEETAEDVRKLVIDGKVGQTEVIEQFEEQFARWNGSKYAIAVANGTLADTIAMATLSNYWGDKKEVILPALTFAAHVNAVIHAGLKPVFVDVMENGLLNGNDKRISYGRDTLCLFPAHLLGRVSGIPQLNSKAFQIVEDACEAMGSRCYGKKVGSLGAMGTFSFFPSHTITTGEGGMIVTDDPIYAEFCRRLRNHSKVSNDSFHFDMIGFNAKMTSMQAVLGIHGLKTIDRVIEKRRNNYLALGGKEEKHEYVSPHGFPVICDSPSDRNYLMEKLRTNGVACRNFFSSIPTQESAYKRFGYKLGDFPVAENIGRCGLYVPCHQGLTSEDIKKIKELINGEEKEASNAKQAVSLGEVN